MGFQELFKYDSIFSVDIVRLHLSGLHGKVVQVSRFGGRDFGILEARALPCNNWVFCI